MANIRNRNGKWQAQVRRNGHSPRTKSFQSKADAQKWARQMEVDLDSTVFAVDVKVLDQIAVRDLLTRYREEVTVSKRGSASENKRIDGFMRQAWANKPLSKATPQVFSRYRDERLKTVSPGTVIRDLGLLRAMFEVARLEWDIPLPENPVAKVRKPKAPDARERRLQPNELDHLLAGCEHNRNDWLKAGILLAVETGMRRGELLSIEWSDINFETSTLFISETKNGHSRRIPLTTKAVEVLRDRMQSDETLSGVVFPVTANAAGSEAPSAKAR